VLGVLLVGIVGMHVEVLKMGSSVGAEMQQASQLQSADGVLRAQVSQLSAPERIEQLAEGMGMFMPGPMDVHMLPATAGNVGKAISNIREPEPDTFLAGLESERALDGKVAEAAANTSAEGVLGGGALSVTTTDQASSDPTDSSTDPNSSDGVTASDPSGSGTTTPPSSAGGTTDGTAAGTNDSAGGDATAGDAAAGDSTAGESTAGDSTAGDATGSTPPSTTGSGSTVTQVTQGTGQDQTQAPTSTNADGAASLAG